MRSEPPTILFMAGLLLAVAITSPVSAATTEDSPVQMQITGVQDGQYNQAKIHYQAAGEAWSQAWGASDIAQIRQYLTKAKTAYTNCLNTANAVNDPANAANLALVRTISTAYIGLADAALAMYDGADIYGAGQTQMNGASYAAAAASFQSAAAKFDSSRTLFGQATTTLQSVMYTGTEYGDGTAYTAVIVPILNAKGAYMGEFATYAQGWQHKALAYQGSASGDQNAFRSEATQAMNLFAGLRSSQAFGADASANYNVLSGLLGNSAPPLGPTVTTTIPPLPTTTVPSVTPSTMIPTTRSVSPISEVEVLAWGDTWDADVDDDGILVDLTFKDINGEIVRFFKGQDPRFELEIWTKKRVGDDFNVKDQLMYSGKGTLETSETILRVPYDDWNIPSDHSDYGMVYVRVYTPDGMVFEGRDTSTYIPK